MTGISSISQTELTERRQNLRRQRRVRGLQASWQALAVSAIAGSLVWVITLPSWVIRKPEQVAIAGNQLLTTQAIQSLIPLTYPQSLLELQPQALVKTLESKAPIAQATVTRHLFPPHLSVQVKERYPVALTSPDPKIAFPTRLQDIQTSSSKLGFLDDQGKWMPLKSYTSLQKSFKLPKLKVIGMRPEYAVAWSQLYQQVQQSPIQVSEIDWRNPGNLILKTDLGIAHLGPYSPIFSKQLSTLDQMRQLPRYLKSTQIDYIDLRNLATPAVQVLKPQKTVKTNTQ
ncbi:MAG: FtsQ-type POTRA domain-containing protein [Leptolyngbyaceae bacterium]|nr:FtsQ-type POTRA domain-containing protein [Leptolyngbyaceae bacterium]